MKKIYNMVDDIPIWQHLKNGAIEKKILLIGPDYGKFAEVLGKRMLRSLTKKGGILDEIFPNICILSAKKMPRVRIEKSSFYERGDLALEISYKNGIGFGKKIVIFEIKHGRFQIDQNQLRRYCAVIDNPGAYFPKADEVKVVYMMFSEIDTLGCSASYCMHELDKNLAHRILNSSPITDNELIKSCVI